MEPIKTFLRAASLASLLIGCERNVDPSFASNVVLDSDSDTPDPYWHASQVRILSLLMDEEISGNPGWWLDVLIRQARVEANGLYEQTHMGDRAVPEYTEFAHDTLNVAKAHATRFGLRYPEAEDQAIRNAALQSGLELSLKRARYEPCGGADRRAYVEMARDYARRLGIDVDSSVNDVTDYCLL